MEFEKTKKYSVKDINNLISDYLNTKCLRKERILYSLTDSWLKYTIMKNKFTSDEDLNQDILSVIFSNLEKYNNNNIKNFRNWVITIVRNSYIDQYRGKKNKKLLYSLDNKIETEKNYNLITDKEENERQLIFLNKIKKYLSETELKVFSFKNEGYSNKKISSLLDKEEISINNIEGNMRVKLRKLLRKEIY